MRTVSKTYDIYKFGELSEKAKDRVRDWFRSFDFPWADEYMASLKALAKHFCGKLSDWQIDWEGYSYSSAKFDMPELEEAEIAELLAGLGSYDQQTLRGNGECKLTGFCADESAIDGFRQAFHGGERNINKLMQAAFKSWLKAAQADCNSQFEDEQLADTCEANEWEFTADGKLFHK